MDFKYYWGPFFYMFNKGDVATFMKNGVNVENSKLIYKDDGESFQDIVLYIANNVLLHKNSKWADNDIVSDVKLELRDK